MDVAEQAWTRMKSSTPESSASRSGSGSFNLRSVVDPFHCQNFSDEEIQVVSPHEGHIIALPKSLPPRLMDLVVFWTRQEESIHPGRTRRTLGVPPLAVTFLPCSIRPRGPTVLILVRIDVVLARGKMLSGRGGIWSRHVLCQLSLLAQAMCRACWSRSDPSW